MNKDNWPTCCDEAVHTECKNCPHYPASTAKYRDAIVGSRRGLPPWCTWIKEVFREDSESLGTPWYLRLVRLIKRMVKKL